MKTTKIRITPAMLKMSARDANWMFRREVIKLLLKNKSYDEIAREILAKDNG